MYSTKIKKLKDITPGGIFEAFGRKYVVLDRNTYSVEGNPGVFCLDCKDYPVEIWNELRCDPDIEISTFRIGDFFVYCNYWDKKIQRECRVTLGDMYQQRLNLEKYGDGYSNIIIHPDGKIGVNWQ